MKFNKSFTADRASAPSMSPPLDNARWPTALDAKIMKTDGKYRNLSKLSQEVGRPVNSLLHRWHQLRPM